VLGGNLPTPNIPGGRQVRPELRANNDPSEQYVLLTELLDRFPAYIHFALGSNADEHWNIEFVNIEVRVSSQDPQGLLLMAYSNLSGTAHLWLGQRSGRYLYAFRTF
jgi:hypothetical protein